MPDESHVHPPDSDSYSHTVDLIGTLLQGLITQGFCVQHDLLPALCMLVGELASENDVPIDDILDMIIADDEALETPPVPEEPNRSAN